MIIFKKFILLSAAIFFFLLLFAVFGFQKSIPVYAAGCDPDFEKSCGRGCIGANDVCCGGGYYCTLGNQCASINGRTACIPNGTSVCGNGYCWSGTNCTSTSSGYRCVPPGWQQCGNTSSFCRSGTNCVSTTSGYVCVSPDFQQCGSGNWFCFSPTSTCVNPSIALCCLSGYSQCGNGCVPPERSCCNLPGTSYYCSREGDVCTNTNNTADGLYCAPADWTSCGGGTFCPFNLSCSGTGASGTCNGILTFPPPQNGEVQAQVNANVRWQQSRYDFGAVFRNFINSYWCSLPGVACFPVNGYLSRIIFPVWAAVGNPTGYTVTVLEETSWGGYIRTFPAVTVSHTEPYRFVTVNFPPDSRPEVKTWNRYYIGFTSLGGSSNYFITVGDEWNGYTLDLEAMAIYVMPKKEVNQGLAPEPVFGPWIQTFGGDVHSNTRINTPGGP